MSYWDYKQGKVIRFKTKPCKEYPAWDEIDCGCCAGIQWGGEEPRECNKCNGSSVIYEHRKSGVRAEYPGGKFI